MNGLGFAFETTIAVHVFTCSKASAPPPPLASLYYDYQTTADDDLCETLPFTVSLPICEAVSSRNNPFMPIVISWPHRGCFVIDRLNDLRWAHVPSGEGIKLHEISSCPRPIWSY